MEMVDLILTVCLGSNPGSCREEHLHFESNGSLMQCLFLAPAEIARWTGEHPRFKVVRWRCAFPNKEQEI
jgi:hypothetical protein